MAETIVFQIITALIAIIATSVAVISFRYARSKDSVQERDSNIATIVEGLTRELGVDVHDLKNNITPALTTADRKISELSDRIYVLRDRIGVLETQVSVFWKNVAYDAARVLHSPHTPELDRLLEDYQNETISTKNKVALVTMLTDIYNDRDRLAGDRIMAATIIRVIQAEDT